MKTVKMFSALVLAVNLIPAAMGAEPTGEKEQKLTSEQLRLAVQEICPVSGQKLGSHGEPVPVKIAKEQVFLCCKSCASGKVKPEHWAKIHANFAKAQRICPVMKNKLPKDAKWTIVEGRIVYVCCPPCIKKVEADPKTHLKQVDELYRESLKQRANR